MNQFGTLTANDTLRIERLLPGPIERVWQYLTDSDKRATWLAAGAMQLQVGGSVEHRFRNSELTGHDGIPAPKYASCAGEVPIHGRITACEPPRRLAYTWGEENGECSEVCFDLTPRGDRVQLVVTHSRLTGRDMLISVAAGWHTHLDILVDRLDERTPAGFWPVHERLEAEYSQRLPIG